MCRLFNLTKFFKNSDEFVSSSNGYVRKFTYKNAEEYLQKKYSDKENTKLIKFNNNALQLSEKGELVISDYPNLEEIRAIGSENINNITKVTVANCSKLKEIDITNFVDNERLEITNCSDLEKLYCGNNKLSAIKGLSECLKLTELKCWKNQLSNLDLTNCGKLNDLECNENQLTQLTLPKLDNLQKLICYNNNLTNLKFVQQSTKLEILSIGDNNITTGLEYLPVSLKEFWCEQRGEIWNELALYGKNLRAWQQTNPELMDDNLSLVNLTLTEQNITPLAVTATPEDLLELLEKFQEAKPIINYTLPVNFSYSEFTLRDNCLLVWEKADSETTTSLPIRLYNFSTEQVETTQGRNDIPHYLALSYVWGTEWENQPRTYGQSYQTDLTKLGRKALNKAIKVWELINKDNKTQLNHIWIDNFCIDQKNKKEKGQEVANQKQYYNNATATLIANDGKIGKRNQQTDLEWAEHIIKQIAISPWFTRSWTFQEGLLSKQTIFMFDDYLVDGRILAKIWVGIQDSVVLNHTTIFSTPLGWSYGANQTDSIKLSLSQALDAVKHRQQTVPLDGLYSILGLLPYGEQATVSYENNTLQQALQELMDLAIKENPSEAISWFGERRNDELWKIPPINKDGSTKIEGFVNITAQPETLQMTKQGILLVGWVDNNVNEEYITIFPNSGQIVSDESFEILVPKSEYSNLPIKVTESVYSATINRKIFIDMINKQVIEGEEEIAEYQVKIEIPSKQN